MNDKTRNAIEQFLKLFDEVFDKDWEYSKEMMGIQKETVEQKRISEEMGLLRAELISDNGTFINPKVEDENEDWGSRGALLEKYRELKIILRE